LFLGSDAAHERTGHAGRLELRHSAGGRELLDRHDPVAVRIDRIENIAHRAADLDTLVHRSGHDDVDLLQRRARRGDDGLAQLRLVERSVDLVRDGVEVLRQFRARFHRAFEGFRDFLRVAAGGAAARLHLVVLEVEMNKDVKVASGSGEGGEMEEGEGAAAGGGVIRRGARPPGREGRGGGTQTFTNESHAFGSELLLVLSRGDAHILLVEHHRLLLGQRESDENESILHTVCLLDARRDNLRGTFVRD
jgi:hypothetical protein